MPDNGSIQKRRARDGSWASCPDNRAHDGNRAAAQPVRCRVRKQKLQIGFIVALVVLALLSGFVARPHFADTKTWDSTIEVIDQKKGNVLALTTSCVALSAGITALPGDTGTPVAEQLAQLSGNGHRACRALPREIFAHDFVVGWLGHLNPVCAGALCGLAWHSRTLEHERCPAPRGDPRAGGCRDRHGLGACKRMGVAKVDETYRVSIEAAEQRRPTLRVRQTAIAPKRARKSPSPQNPRTCLSSLPTVPRVLSRR